MAIATSAGRAATGPLPPGERKACTSPRGGLPEGSAQAHHSGGRLRVGVVLYVDDLALPQPEDLCPGVPMPVAAVPGQRNDDPIATRPDRLKAVLVAAVPASLRYPSGENLTG